MFNRKYKKVKCKATGEMFSIKCKQDYTVYLQSEHFRIIKQRALVRQKGRCVACRKEMTITCVGHHKTTKAYKRLGKEKAGRDVVAVCNQCHDGKSKTHQRLHMNIKVPIWAKCKN